MICRSLLWLLLSIPLFLSVTGCGTFMADRMAQAPNTYPTWFAPKAPVLLDFNPKLLTNFPRQFVTVGPPPAKLCYRIIEPADYQFAVSSTNWLDHGAKRTQFTFLGNVPGQSNRRTSNPRGTLILLHGYALAQFSMLPWALRLAQDGWQCVLVDLRGHGRSTGLQIYFGLQEVKDLSQLLDELARDGKLKVPVSVMGESYGGAVALRWKMVEPRIQSVVAIAPYGSLSNAVMNIRQEYADWMPKVFIKAGLIQLPVILNTNAAELDTTTKLKSCQVSALFVADQRSTPGCFCFNHGEEGCRSPSNVPATNGVAAPQWRPKRV